MRGVLEPEPPAGNPSGSAGGVGGITSHVSRGVNVPAALHRPSLSLLSMGMLDPNVRPGGLDRYRLGLEAALGQRGHKVKNVVLESAVDSYGLRRLASIRKIVRLKAGSELYDIVACHFALTGWGLGKAVARGAPWVVHFHGPWAQEGRAEGGSYSASVVKRLVEHGVYAKAKRLLVLSRAFGDFLVRRYRVPESRVHVVPAGVDHLRFTLGDRSEARRVLGLPQDRFIVLSVRRLVRRMGLNRIIEAAKQDREGDVLWLIAGGGALEHDLRSRVAEAGLNDRVKILGRVSEETLPILYRAADLFVLPSMALEGFGLIILEALSSGVPVIGTRVGGIPEVLEPYSADSLLSATPTSEEIWDRVKQVRDGKVRLPVQEEAREFVLKRYTWEIAAQAVEREYLEAVGASV